MTNKDHSSSSGPLDLSRPFLPEALAGLAGSSSSLLREADDMRAMNQIRAASYLHIFDLLETQLSEAARAHAMKDVDARDTLGPLLRLDAFDHNELFHGFERAFEAHFPVTPKLLPRSSAADLDEMLNDAVPLSLLILALHVKLVTQQHYLACVRGDESLEPHFVRVLKEHWAMECGRTKQSTNPAASSSSLGNHDRFSTNPPSHVAIQQALAAALPGRVPAALRDYRRIVFTIDDVLRRQSELDVSTLEAVRGKSFSTSDHAALALVQFMAHRKTFITFGIVNAAFVYAMRSLGPSAPATLAGVVSALSSRE